ncbi:myeloid-derived growth factor isoform X2 [Hyperolius riggenbachi]|uniref:myeloid-derived growth factor isoform X2 n=1 Tax=Hyperolius riggenbachi TaxID=752182 RepID=UPI0035A399FE
MAASMVVVIAVLSVVVGAQAEAIENAEEFDVKPGGLAYTYSRTLKWLMNIWINEDNHDFTCSIWRPLGTSYLFFLKFKAEVTGGKIESCEAYSQEGKSLQITEYEVTDTAVSDRPGSFSSALYKIILVAKSCHGEL